MVNPNEASIHQMDTECPGNEHSVRCRRPHTVRRASPYLGNSGFRTQKTDRTADEAPGEGASTARFSALGEACGPPSTDWQARNVRPRPPRTVRRHR